MNKEKHSITVIYAYDLPKKGEEYRVLVESFWPRGITKKKLGLDRWAKNIAPLPNTGVRPELTEASFAAFSRNYRAQLDASTEAALFAEEISAILEKKDVWILFAERNPSRNHAFILTDWLMNYMRGSEN